MRTGSKCVIVTSFDSQLLVMELLKMMMNYRYYLMMNSHSREYVCKSLRFAKKLLREETVSNLEQPAQVATTNY